MPLSTAIKIYQGRFGRVALLDMSTSLIGHAHHHCHLLLKVGGADAGFRVRGQLAPLTDHSAVLVNAWEYHAYEHSSSDRTMVLALYIEPSWLAEIHRTLTLSSHPRFFPQSSVAISAGMHKKIDEFVLEMWWADDVTSLRLEHLLFDLVLEVIEGSSEWKDLAAMLRQRPSAAMDPRIRRAIYTLRENVGRASAIDELADSVGLSRAHFFALFQRDTQVTPLVYANVLRFEAAVQRLSQSSESVSSIADDLGFSVPGHFARFFRAHLGITPTDYRKKVNLFEAPTSLDDETP